MRQVRRRSIKRAFERYRLKQSRLDNELDFPLFDFYEDYENPLRDYELKYLRFTSGRGSIKSTTIVSFLIEESFNPRNKDSLFVFGREVQTSVKESVHAMVKAGINAAHVSRFFNITDTRIFNKRNGVEFTFTGLRSTGGKTAFSQVNKIKGKFNIKYIFVDEAQDLTDDTINVLFPTVNRGSVFGVLPKPWHPVEDETELAESRFLFAMNPNFADDPITVKIDGIIADAERRGIKSPAMVIQRNLEDLPAKFQDPQLLQEMEQDRGEVYFDHVWRGAPSHKISGYPWANIVQAKYNGKPKCMLSFIDPSFKGGDYTAIMFFGMVDGRFAAWGHAFKESWQNAMPKIAALIQKYTPSNNWYEDNALGTSPQNMLAEYGIHSLGETTLGNKENRIYKVAYYCVDKVVLISNHSNNAFISQVLRYNEEADNDDAPDSLANGLIKAGLVTEKMKF